MSRLEHTPTEVEKLPPGILGRPGQHFRSPDEIE